jgi:hypothetical protein
LPQKNYRCNNDYCHISFADTILVFCHVMIVIAIEVIATNDWWCNRAYWHERWSLHKMLRQWCYAWQKQSIATKLVVVNPILCKASLSCNNQTFATTQKNVVNPIATWQLATPPNQPHIVGIMGYYIYLGSIVTIPRWSKMVKI